MIRSHHGVQRCDCSPPPSPLSPPKNLARTNRACHLPSSADIVFVIKAKPHARFTREDQNLIYTVTITLEQALTGKACFASRNPAWGGRGRRASAFCLFPWLVCPPTSAEGIVSGPSITPTYPSCFPDSDVCGIGVFRCFFRPNFYCTT